VTARDFLLALAIVAAGCGRRAAPAAAVARTSPSGAAPGFQAYRDPVSGAFVPTAPASALALQRAQAAAPAPTLTETSAPGGGTMVKLDQRFQGLATAVIGPHGVETSCATSTAPR
jgi:hypothetical protein